MKFTTSSVTLRDALTTVGGAVPSKSTLPILECILFEHDADSSELRLSATDLEISIVERKDIDTVYVVSIKQRKLLQKFKTTSGAGPDPAMRIHSR